MSGDCQRPKNTRFMKRSGRPMSMNGKSAPTHSATTVISSAMRVIESCQRALVARRIAERSVPAWLMPMKNTKLAM